MRDRPDLAQWWIEAEAEAEAEVKTGTGTQARFRSDAPSYAKLFAQVQQQPELPFAADLDDAEDEIVDCFCGSAS